MSKNWWYNLKKWYVKINKILKIFYKVYKVL